jgi:hypothetical protein
MIAHRRSHRIHVLKVGMHVVGRQRFGSDRELVAVGKFGAAEARFDGEDLLNRFDIKVDVEVREVIHPGRDMSVHVPVQTHPFKGDVRTPSRLAGQRDDPFVGREALCLWVNLPILVPVKAVVPIGICGGEAFQNSRQENNAKCFGCSVIVELGIAGHYSVTHAGICAEHTSRS